MIEALLVLLVFQLAGEAITHAAALPLPGPVLGLVLFAIALKTWPALAKKVSTVAHGILRNLSLLFVTHDLGQARRLADDVIFLRDGKLAEHTPAQTFFDTPASQAARDYLDGRLVIRRSQR